MQSEACVVCAKSLVEGGEFCPFCGARRLAPSTATAIDTYIQNKLDLELSRRLTDHASLVREIGDQAEDVVWKRLRHYGSLFGALLACILAFIAFLGIRTLSDVSQRIEPIVRATEQRAQAARQTVEETASRVDSVKASLDQLSHDVETQTKRVAQTGGEMSRKFKSLDEAAGAAQKRGEAYREHSEEFSRHLKEIESALESRVEQVSREVDNISIRQAYPTLGQERFVTYGGAKWKGAAGKALNEKWVNISIDPRALGEISPAQLEKLMTELKDSDYTPLLGRFGVGGPYPAGYGSLGDTNEPTVFYFRKDSEQAATAVCAIASKALSIRDLKPRLADPSAMAKDDDRRFIIEGSGLDLQLVLFHSQR